MTENTAEKITKIIAEQAGVNPDLITPESTFDKLALDSLDKVEVAMAIEEEFNLGELSDSDYSSWDDVGDIIKFVTARQKNAA